MTSVAEAYRSDPPEPTGVNISPPLWHPGGGGGTSILGHIGDVWPEWVTFLGRKPADGCKFLTKNLRMGHNCDIILPRNG